MTSSPAKSSLSGGAAAAAVIGTNEYRELRAQLDNSEVKVQKLIESNDDMRTEISRLARALFKFVISKFIFKRPSLCFRLSMTVNKLISENEHLRVSLSPTHQPHHNNSAASFIRGSAETGSIPFADAASQGGGGGGSQSHRSSPGPRASSAANDILHRNSGASGPTSLPGQENKQRRFFFFLLFLFSLKCHHLRNPCYS